jgi:hypothetical protein
MERGHELTISPTWHRAQAPETPESATEARCRPVADAREGRASTMTLGLEGCSQREL